MAGKPILFDRLLQEIGLNEIVTKLLGAAGASDSGATWLASAIERLDGSDGLADELSMLWAMARRKLGDEPLGDRLPTLDSAQGTVVVANWPAGDAGRVAMLLHAASIDADPAALASAVFRYGDETERAAVIRALPLLPDPQGLRPLALEAGRVNSLLLFSALAQDNPYPAGVYSEHEFNQLVLKSLFTGLEVGRIVGLDRRANAELSRMCCDYVGEREAAGRDVPRDIWLALAPHADEAAMAVLVRYLADADADHRYNAATALAGLDDVPETAVAAARRQRDAETDEATLGQLGQLLDER